MPLPSLSFKNIVLVMRKMFKKISLSALAVFLTIFAVIYLNSKTSFWNYPDRIISYDIVSYYAYLPATFVYNDFTLSFIDQNRKEFGDKFWPKTTPTGKYVIITSYGMSAMYFPFFIVAHPIAQFLGYEANGFTAPYKFAIVFSSMFYLLLGLIFLRKLLLKYFSELVIALVVLSVILSTNLLWYATVEAAMTHVYSFSLISIFLYSIDRWHEKITLKRSLWIGLLLGIISLIRPTNIVVIVLLVFWKVTSFGEFRDRILFFLKKWYHVLAMLPVFFIIWLPQFLYWKTVAGQYLYFSYPDSNHFYFGNPQIINNLLSWRKGWLVYTPVMALSLVGIGLMFKNNKAFFVATLVYLLISIYIISSWWDWWYGGGFGNRPYIDSYGVYAFGLGTFLSWLFKQKKWLITVGTGVFLILSMLGTLHHIRYYHGSIHWDSMTREAYFDSFFRARPSDAFFEKLRAPDYELARQGIYRYLDESTPNHGPDISE